MCQAKRNYHQEDRFKKTERTNNLSQSYFFATCLCIITFVKKYVYNWFRQLHHYFAHPFPPIIIQESNWGITDNVKTAYIFRVVEIDKQIKQTKGKIFVEFNK